MVEHRTNLVTRASAGCAELAGGRSRFSRLRGSVGFTLLELCLVIGIISILAALLSAAFSTTKARSQRVTCVNNLYQLQIAWRMYIDDNEDWLPLNRSVDGPLNERFFGRRNSSNSWVCGSPKEDVTPVNIVKGTLFPYTEKSVGVYRCPADRSTVVGHKDILRTRSYSMSAYLNGDDEGLDPRVKTKEIELVNGAEKVFVFIEEHEASAWLGSFRILPREKFTVAAGSWTSTPSDRHTQGCNISFADTHVEYWKWYWPKKANLQSKLTANGHELRDLRRLQESVPRP